MKNIQINKVYEWREVYEWKVYEWKKYTDQSYTNKKYMNGKSKRIKNIRMKSIRFFSFLLTKPNGKCTQPNKTLVLSDSKCTRSNTNYRHGKRDYTIIACLNNMK